MNMSVGVTVAMVNVLVLTQQHRFVLFSIPAAGTALDPASSFHVTMTINCVSPRRQRFHSLDGI